jgi:hypothetical protein
MLEKLPPSILKTEAGTTQAKLLAPFGTQLDELKVVEADMMTLGEIQTAVGQNLDQIGKILNELRQGRVDATYRTFLEIAVMKLVSKGDIFSINEIAQALGFTNLTIIEAFDGGGRLDGLSLLDGSQLLDDVDRPATFLFFQDINVDDVSGSFEIATVINAVRAAGVYAQISFIFTSNQAQGVTSSVYDGLLDATGFMDGETALNPLKADLTPNYIALRDAGGEVLRKAAITYLDDDGNRIHQITVDQTELDGVTIITLQLYKDAVLMWTDTFTGKVKDDETIFVFKMKETD